MANALNDRTIITRNNQRRTIEVRMHAKQLAKLLRIDLGSFSGREMPAALIMAMLALMPTVRDHDKRRAFGNEILQNADHLLPSTEPANGAFWFQLRPLVIAIQEFRDWYRLFSASAEELIRS